MLKQWDKSYKEVIHIGMLQISKNHILNLTSNQGSAN